MLGNSECFFYGMKDDHTVRLALQSPMAVYLIVNSYKKDKSTVQYNFFFFLFLKRKMEKEKRTRRKL